MLDYQSPARAFMDAPAELEFASERLARQIRASEIKANERSEQSRRHRTALYALYVALAAIFTLSAISGLSRAETAFQQEARV